MFLHLYSTETIYCFVRKIPRFEFKCSLDRSSEKLSSLEDSIRIIVLLMMMMEVLRDISV